MAEITKPKSRSASPSSFSSLSPTSPITDLLLPHPQLLLFIFFLSKFRFISVIKAHWGCYWCCFMMRPHAHQKKKNPGDQNGTLIQPPLSKNQSRTILVAHTHTQIVAPDVGVTRRSCRRFAVHKIDLDGEERFPVIHDPKTDLVRREGDSSYRNRWRKRVFNYRWRETRMRHLLSGTL